MNRILYGANMSIENLLSEYVKGYRITFDEFCRICKRLVDKLTNKELESIFKELDRAGRGELDKEEFSQRFSRLE
jgi:Ca2+-binding EF-hand superfamily protein